MRYRVIVVLPLMLPAMLKLPALVVTVQSPVWAAGFDSTLLMTT